MTPELELRAIAQAIVKEVALSHPNPFDANDELIDTITARLAHYLAQKENGLEVSSI